MSEPVNEVMSAVMRLLGICSAGMDRERLSEVAVLSALDELKAIDARGPESMLTAAAVQTGELFLIAAETDASPELARATGGLRVLLAALSVAQNQQLCDQVFGVETR
jgi:hypothetical protein